MGKMGMRDIVLSTRVRLARNFADLPFPGAMRGGDGAKSQFMTANALAHSPLGKQYSLYRIYDISDTQKRAFLEKGLISNELLWAGEHAALLIRRDQKVCIMLNEADHVRVHVLFVGNQVERAMETAMELDEAIGERTDYAFDSELGYITSSPINLGTGVRISCLLHLPALERSGAVADLVQEAARRKLSIRPLHREGNNARGQLYTLSNHASLGKSEQDLINTIKETILDIAIKERTSRELLLLDEDSRLDDILMRSFGILQYARRMGESEWSRRWSDMRLAVLAGLLSFDLNTLDSLFQAAKPAHLELAAGRDLSPVERDTHRAQLVREAMHAASA